MRKKSDIEKKSRKRSRKKGTMVENNSWEWRPDVGGVMLYLSAGRAAQCVLLPAHWGTELRVKSELTC